MKVRKMLKNHVSEKERGSVVQPKKWNLIALSRERQRNERPLIL